MSSEDSAVTNFREYLRIQTVQPNPDYDSAVQFFRRQASELDLPCNVIECHPGKPVVIITWLGTQPELPTLVLNSHIDVVPVFEEFWKYPPFSAHKDENGDIYARGSQDMKCVGIQYIEAVKRLKSAGKTFKRTIHMTFVPDEEIGGAKGMEMFTKTADFAALNVGFALDEGLANTSSKFTLFYGERAPWQEELSGVLGMKKFIKMDEFRQLNIGYALDEGLANPTEAIKVYYGERYHGRVKVTCTGNPGHGSRFIENNAAEKFRKVVNNFLAFRDSEERKLKENPALKLGDVTTTNMNIVSGGVQVNVVPAEMSASFDIRVTPTTDLEKFQDKIHQMCTEAGEGVTYEYLQQFMNPKMTSISPDDPWFSAFKAACDKHNVQLEPEIFPAATDSRFLRALGLPALGFSPMNNTPILLHDHNEFLNEKIFLRGIDIYCDIIPNLASV